MALNATSTASHSFKYELSSVTWNRLGERTEHHRRVVGVKFELNKRQPVKGPTKHLDLNRALSEQRVTSRFVDPSAAGRARRRTELLDGQRPFEFSACASRVALTVGVHPGSQMQTDTESVVARCPSTP